MKARPLFRLATGTRPRTIWLALSVLIFLLGAVIAPSWTDRQPPSARVQPLIPITDAPGNLTINTPLRSSGRYFYVEGQFFFLADADFNTGLLQVIDPDVELIDDHPAFDGKRIIVARVPDDRVNAMIAALGQVVGVQYPERNWAATVDSVT